VGLLETLIVACHVPYKEGQNREVAEDRQANSFEKSPPVMKDLADID